ncbi:MAG: hypothetical protein IT444_06830 [Phycisphaeraceae bacterium]|nr:hypothetical protein [Phycisphaeraceae bacterium]
MSPLTARTFLVDVTPPVGGYLCGGLHTLPSLGIEQTLSLRGMILDTGGSRVVIAAVEFCYLCGRSHQRLIETLAEAADVPTSHVTVHSVHTHDAPLIYEEVHHLYQPAVHDEEYFWSILGKARLAVRAAMASPGTTVGSISFASESVIQFASSRRIIDENNRCHIRFSKCQDPKIKTAPEGRIDPMLDQIAFHNPAGKAFACWSFYASHPQVSDGRRLVSGDTVGVCLELFEKSNPGVFPIYFTGCAGDVTAGKYTTTHPSRDRLAFGVRLFDAMQAAFQRQVSHSVPIKMAWRDATFPMPLRSESNDLTHYERVLNDPAALTNFKYLAGLKAHKLRNRITSYPFRLSRLTLGPYDVLFLPSELVIDYQFFAKSLTPDPGVRKIAVSAYGDSFLNYVGTDKMFDQGGYEVDPAWTEVDRGCEGLIKDAIRKILTN